MYKDHDFEKCHGPTSEAQLGGCLFCIKFANNFLGSEIHQRSSASDQDMRSATTILFEQIMCLRDFAQAG